MAATVDFYKGKGGLPGDGILSVSVPARWPAPSSRRRPTAPSRCPNCWRPPSSSPIAASRSPNRSPARSATAASKLSPSAKEIWFNGNTPLGFGDRVIQKDLAATLREIGAKGSAAFYQGPIAEKFAAYMKAEGGLIDQKDLAGIKANEDTPVQDQLQGHRRLRVPAELAGLRDAAGAQHPRRDERALHAPQQRAVPARGHRIAEARLRRSQQVRRRSEVHAEHPDARDAVEGIRGDPPRADRSGQGDRRRSAVRQSRGQPTRRSSQARSRMRRRSRDRTTRR